MQHMDDLRTRDMLAANLRRMIDAAAPRGQKPSLRACALARELDVKLIDRLVKAEHAVTLDKLEEVASACGLKAWQLLYEDLDPAAPPDSPVSAEERVMLARLRKILGP